MTAGQGTTTGGAMLTQRRSRHTDGEKHCNRCRWCVGFKSKSKETVKLVVLLPFVFFPMTIMRTYNEDGDVDEDDDDLRWWRQATTDDGYGVVFVPTNLRQNSVLFTFLSMLAAYLE
ncbi:uncharacterized protein LOC110938935 [Helianthus annuus]|uniref:uncharacterized protein LOC110938935 n=1 Tax=Helianthus annuus TaxID=4232 RepID=UPI000B908A2F|nr:uncharacterized protein LOC110938935 [Helianthus annuus]